MGNIGITTTVPQEIIWASGNIPVDLNNIFIGSDKKTDLLERAYRDGYPRTMCPWISGIYGTVVEEFHVDRMVVVTQGDCSNTHALAETLQDKGVEIIPFAFPYDSDVGLLEGEMRHLAQTLGAEWSYILDCYERLRPSRELAWKLDELTWKKNLVSGWENHLWLLQTSDFIGKAEKYLENIKDALEEVRTRKPFDQKVRLGYMGVPPIFSDLYDDIENSGGRVVFNEVQRQFSIPYPVDDFVDAYAKYTYPASVFKRIKDIKEQIEVRNIHGIVHYVQNFCFRQIEDLLFRKYLGVPILTIEGENSFELDERIRIRLDSFIKMLEDKIE